LRKAGDQAKALAFAVRREALLHNETAPFRVRRGQFSGAKILSVII
jgi:hypothetical protein